MPKPKVTAVDFIAVPTGAVHGFPTIEGIDLNVPGVHNDTTTTFGYKVVIQIKVTLAAGTDLSEVAVGRKVLRLASVRNDDGTVQPINKTTTSGGATGDGPSASTVVRSDASTIAVSDAPGYAGGPKERFPVIYHASYDLYAWDTIEHGILAQVSYVVDFQKKTSTDASPTLQPFHVITKIWP
jgi:hypothetical protein